MGNDTNTRDAEPPVTGRTVHDWFEEYSRYHQNPTNKVIHWICVPVIMVTLLALLWSIPVPNGLRNASVWINFATLLYVVSVLFYLRLSIPLAAVMGLSTAAILYFICRFHQATPDLLWQASAAVFAIAWVGQFVGHKIEGKKPAFFQDIQFLLVGPIWLLGFIFRRLGIRY